MNKRDLYRDVLNEGASADFEEALFRKTVVTAKRVRRTRIAVRTVVLAAVVGLLSLQLFPRRETVFVGVPRKLQPARVLVHGTLKTEPFGNVLRTETLGAEHLLASTVNPVPAFTTAGSGVELHRISDEQLLALFQDRAVALIKDPARGTELVIFDDVSK